MILFQCSCGSAHGVDERYAGGTAQCDNCGERLPIPAESDPDVALIYRSGGSEDGTPMIRAAVAGMLASGELSSTDLFWHENTWHPLEDIMGESDVAAEQRGRGLAGKCTDEAGQALKELEDSIGELSPLHKDEVPEAILVDNAAPKREKRGGLRRLLPFGKKKASVEAEAVPEDAEAEVKPRNKKVYVATQAAMGVLAVVLGFKFGVGPLISSVRKKPMRVIVQNHDGVDYVAKLGWRRLTQELYKDSVCGFEVFVGMPEKQTLRLAPKEGGKSFKLRIPLRPGGTLLVNLNQKGHYGVFDQESVRGKKIGAELSRLGNEIAKNAAPNSAIGAANSAHKIAQSSFKTTVNDLLFHGEDYQFPLVAMYGVAPDPEEKKNRPFLAFPPVRRVDFSGGNAIYDHRQPKHIQCSLRFPPNVKAVVLSKSYKVNLDPKQLPSIEITNDSKKISLSMRITQNGVKLDTRTFAGTWQYLASRPLTGNKPTWTWTWTYQGNSSAGGKHYRASVTVQPGGKETKKITEIRP